jgi:RNA ligase
MTIHPARMMAFDELFAGLNRAMERGFVYRRYNEELGLHLYSYTAKCVYDDGWDQYSMLARGLIIDEVNKTVVATPFLKFFNIGERQAEVPTLPFEAFEKTDEML